MKHAIVLLLAIGVLVGCSGKTPENSVVVRDFEFSPSTLQVPAGTTVTWQFEGPTPHSTTSDPTSAVRWDSGVQEAGKTFRHRFDTAGTFPYHCGPHPYMKGTIVVRQR